MEFTNSLIAGSARDCVGRGYFLPPGDASLDSDGSCAAIGFEPGVATASLAAIGIGGLAANGGPTQTEEISPTSVDARTCLGFRGAHGPLRRSVWFFLSHVTTSSRSMTANARIASASASETRPIRS